MIDRTRHVVGLVSTGVAQTFSHPVVQLIVLVACVIWLVLGKSEAALASTLTIGGFVLTQMVLNQQRRQDKALHLKIDELLIAMEGARNEVTGAENVSEAEIDRLRAAREAPEPD